MTTAHDLTVALGVLCPGRPHDLANLLESARSHSFNEVVVIDMASTPPLGRHPAATTWFRSDRNLGCPGGRNQLTKLATCDIVYFVDDDAVLIGDVDQAALLRSFFADHPDVATVAGLIRRANGHVARHEFPFPGEPGDLLRPRRAGYMVGASAAVRRTALEEVGGYDPSFFLLMEEMDLATRLHQKGWVIWYLPDISVEHRPPARSRPNSAATTERRMRNRLVYCRRSLPWPIAVVHAAIWMLIIGRDALRERTLRAWWAGWVSGLRDPVTRDTLSWPQAITLHRLGGRVWW